MPALAGWSWVKKFESCLWHACVLKGRDTWWMGHHGTDLQQWFSQHLHLTQLAQPKSCSSFLTETNQMHALTLFFASVSILNLTIVQRPHFSSIGAATVFDCSNVHSDWCQLQCALSSHNQFGHVQNCARKTMNDFQHKKLLLVEQTSQDENWLCQWSFRPMNMWVACLMWCQLSMSSCGTKKTSNVLTRHTSPPEVVSPSHLLSCTKQSACESFWEQNRHSIKSWLTDSADATDIAHNHCQISVLCWQVFDWWDQNMKTEPWLSPNLKAAQKFAAFCPVWQLNSSCSQNLRPCPKPLGQLPNASVLCSFSFAAALLSKQQTIERSCGWGNVVMKQANQSFCGQVICRSLLGTQVFTKISLQWSKCQHWGNLITISHAQRRTKCLGTDAPTMSLPQLTTSQHVPPIWRANCNTPNWAQSRASSCRAHSSGIHTRKWRSSSARDWSLLLSPVFHKQWRTLLRRVTSHCQKTLVCGMQRLHLLDRHMPLGHVLFLIAQCKLSSQNIHSKVDNKSATSTPILRVEASFISVERGLHRGILSQISLKHHICFSSFQSLQFSFANNSKGLWLLTQCKMQTVTLWVEETILLKQGEGESNVVCQRCCCSLKNTSSSSCTGTSAS